MRTYFKISLFIQLPILIITCLINSPSYGNILHRQAKNTITPVEMNIGDTLKFKLHNGQTRTLILLETDADVIITNLETLKKNQQLGGTLYWFTCKMIIDGQPMKMARYVGSQESFYEPYVVNGMRIWFDGAAAIFEKGIVSETHGPCKPGKDARFAITDMTDRICPEPVFSFYDNKENHIDIAQCFEGNDCWMGAYNGYDAHGGLDINLPKSTPNYTPFGIDDHFFTNSLHKGHNNNRWRGTRTWNNGDYWSIQNNHMLNLLVPENTPIEGGTHYSDASGVYGGYSGGYGGRVDHAHYGFRIKTLEDEKEILLDPWIL
ncbi:MAG: hypothetical protein ACOCVN_02095, partial [bacterium]